MKAVVAEAKSWVGVPFRHQGRSRLGVDCVGVVAMVCQGLKISDYDIRGYDRRPVAAQFLAHFTKGGARRIGVLVAQPGDIMAFRDDEFPCHIGILSMLAGRPSLIHSILTRGEVVEDRIEAALLQRRVAAFVLPGVG